MPPALLLSLNFSILSLIDPMRLDKSAFSKQSFADAADHRQHYAQMSDEEKAKSFRYLMSVAYGFVDSEWPRMDKTVFRMRKHQ